ncbi:hypothetical protein SSAG_00555 [Streptomyces sp. Mg1]|nr:hypothetical protein SSAG_00555 [Streptomyces sp. Mg1]
MPKNAAAAASAAPPGATATATRRLLDVFLGAVSAASPAGWLRARHLDRFSLPSGTATEPGLLKLRQRRLGHRARVVVEGNRSSGADHEPTVTNR